MLEETVHEFIFFLKVSWIKQEEGLISRVEFNILDEIRNLFDQSRFVEEENRTDKRLQVNRGRLLKMYRVWIQAKYKKI